MKVSPTTENITVGMYPVVLLINDRAQTETKTIYIKVIGAAEEPTNCLDCTVVIINPEDGNITDDVGDEIKDEIKREEEKLNKILNKQDLQEIDELTEENVKEFFDRFDNLSDSLK